MVGDDDDDDDDENDDDDDGDCCCFLDAGDSLTHHSGTCERNLGKKKTSKMVN